MKSNIMGFGQIEGAFVITLERGVFRQVELYEREGKLFAKQKGGFIALNNDGKTSCATVSWKGISGANFKREPMVYGVLEIDHESK